MEFPQARQRFYSETRQPNEEINLAKAALYIAQEDYPKLDVDEYLNALDTMAAELSERLPAERYPMRTIQAINSYLYEDLGFSGNTTNYYDPRNSFLHQVIDRRTGIPITLSLVYLEIAKRIEFPMVGIGMPGHFIIRPNFEDSGIFIDAFNKGEILFPEDCKERIRKIFNRNVPLRPEFLEAIDSRGFLARMLGNLKMIYLQKGQAKKCLAAIERILLLFPDAPLELRDRGLLYYQSQRWNLARPDLEAYLDRVPHAPDAPLIRQVLDRINDNN